MLPDIGALSLKAVEETKCDSQFLFDLDQFLELGERQKRSDRVIEEADEENDEVAVSLESENYGHVETSEFENQFENEEEGET